MEHILEKCLREFEHIQGSQKGSMGSINNVYLPQLDRRRLDELVEEIRGFYMKYRPKPRTMKNQRLII